MIDTDSIRVLEHIPTNDYWARRNSIVLPMVRTGASIFDPQRNPATNSLALIKPTKIIRFEIDRTPDEDFKKQVHNLEVLQSQMSLFPEKEEKKLQLVPYSFRYIYTDETGKVHRQKIVDWEIYQLYRNCQYKPNWESLIRQKYEVELLSRDIHFFLGTMHPHPTSWIIIGVYYPNSSVLQPNMFDSQLSLG